MPRPSVNSLSTTPPAAWVEHDPEEIWSTTLAVTRKAFADAGGMIAAVGITNQRETTVIWDRSSGTPIHRAIVWQDRRTAARCRELRDAGHEPAVSEKTGLLLDPYFSATKIAWILDHVDGARERAAAGELAFGTIDTFSSGVSPAAPYTPPTPPTRHAPFCSTSTHRSGTTPCCGSSTSRARSFPMSATAPPTSE